MYEEILISSILQASITGAGLILAVFALLTPIGSRLIKHRLDNFHETCNELSDKMKKAKKGPKYFDMEDAESQFNKLYEFKDALGFSKIVMFVPFLLYISCVILSLWWLIGYSPMGDLTQLFNLTYYIFGIATLGFACMGYRSLKSIYNLFDTEYKSK